MIYLSTRICILPQSSLTAFNPPKADAPLLIDPDAHLSGTIALEAFEPVAGRVAQVLLAGHGVKLPQLAKHVAASIGRMFHTAVT